MDAYLLETSTLSALLDTAHKRHEDASRIVGGLAEDAPKYVSVVALAELSFGVQLAHAVNGVVREELKSIVADASSHPILDVTKHTAESYAELKTQLAMHYLEKKNRANRARWLEDWVDRNTGKTLQVDENDLWMCAQARERGLVLVTADEGIKRISEADPSVKLMVV